MKTLDQIKKKVARDFIRPYSSWEECAKFSNDENISILEDSGAIDEVAKRYAKEVAKQALKNASNNVKIKHSYGVLIRKRYDIRRI